ncbi:histidinol dehydrogenase [Patescibacteria group bacterium]|nr:histidinol dehydrogenase [Patescibacteria group bacterium]
MQLVTKIIKEVRKNGDSAVRKYTAFFDDIKIKKFRVSKEEIKEAYRKIDKRNLKAIEIASQNIKEFAQKQLEQFQDFEYNKDGVAVGQKIVPIEKIGVYVPGGNYPLPSTALMCIIPAKVAGVRNIFVCSPKIKIETIVAADFAGADLIFKVGGAQAIAAMAYGTSSIPKVDKIVGPGNKYVTQAKKEIFGDCGIDFLAGPSELLIIGDKWANPKFIAADLLAQSEHDIEAKITFITDSLSLIKEVEKELKLQIKKMRTKSISQKTLRRKKIIKVKNLSEAISLANELAPEHLVIMTKNPKKLLNKAKNYGSLFLGDYSAVVFGDYGSGTNHVLPTNKTAKYTGGLSVKDFIKIQTYQYINKKGASKLKKIGVNFANMEGLDAHKKSIEIR